MHILFVRFSSMGDVVLQTATINWLKSLLGSELKVSFVTSQEFVSLIDSHPAVSKTLGFNRRGERWSDLIKRVKELHQEDPIDLILDLHATLRSARLRLSLWSIPALTVDKRRWERFLLTKIKSTKIKKIFNLKALGLEPQVERIIRDFESIFGDDNRGVRRTMDFVKGPHGELTTLKELPIYPIANPYIVIAPSASFLYKRWPVNYFVDLAHVLLEKTNLDLVVLAGPSDDFCQAFNQIQSPRLHNLQGKTSLRESMSVLERSKLCIGNDSGMNHISEAYGVPCVTLFGPTDPRFGFAPHGNKSIFISRELWCKPCSTTGKSACYRERHFCMEEISVKEVSDASLKILEAN